MSQRKLSQQQRTRIGQLQARRCQTLVDPVESWDGTAEGRIVAQHGANLVVADCHGVLHVASVRQNIGRPVCGDRVVWQPTPPAGAVILALLPRQSVLSRADYAGRAKPLAANLSLMVIVVAPTPAPTPYLVDQYLVTAEQMGIAALLVINKVDLLPTQTTLWHDFAAYAQAGYTIVPVSLYQEATLLLLAASLAAHTSIFVGQSGVGKSSLIQSLLPDRAIQTGRLSQATGLGCHTTSATTWYHLPSGGALIDSPGVRSLRLGRLERPQLAQSFREFRPYLGHCRFGDCRHDQEPGCAIITAVAQGAIHPQRLAHFRHMANRMDAALPLEPSQVLDP